MRYLAICALCAAAAAAQPSPAGAKWMEADGVSIPVPPAERPRLYLRARDVPELKRRIAETPLQRVWADLREAAGKSPQIRAEVDALQYLFSGDRTLGRETVERTLALLQKAHFDPKIQDVTRPIGRMMVTGAVVYDWCYPLLTKAQKEAFYTELLRLAKELECGYPPRRPNTVIGHTSEWMIMRDLLSAGIALYDESPEMYRTAARLVLADFVPVRNWWYRGHAFHQGSAYAETRFSSDLYPLWIFDRLGAGNIYDPAQQFVGYQWIYMRRPDNQLLRSGDGQFKVPKLRSLLLASYYGDGYLLGDYLKTPGIDPMSKLYELLWSDPGLKPLPAADLPLSRYMGGPYGWMVARTGWDSGAVIAEMKVNVFNFINHQHHDAGAFQIYYKGPLAIDSGLYEGADGAYNSPHHLNYTKRTIAHNSLLVYDPDERFIGNTGEVRNDGGQRLNNNWRAMRDLQSMYADGFQTGKVLGRDFGPDQQRPAYTYLAGDITQAYTSKVVRARRSFVFLNLFRKDVPAALLVFDDVEAANAAFRKYWLLHSMEEPAADGNRYTVTLSERGWTGKLEGTALAPDIAIEKIGGPGKEYFVFGVNFPNRIRPGADPNGFELGSWRIEATPRAASAQDYFLNVMQVMDRQTQPLGAARLSGDGTLGALIADRAVVFAKTDQPVLRFTLPAKASVLVAGLAEGSWQVRHQGRILRPATYAGGGSGTLYFESPAGELELRR